MNIRSLQQGLQYCGRVTSVRQSYHVFEARNHYFVLSFARARSRAGSGYFNLIAKPAVDYVQAKFGGNARVTAKEIATRRTKLIRTSLQALNVLYILVALGQATIARQGERRQLFFSVRKRKEQ